MSNELDIAVVGMAGRFPGARDIDELWRALHEGRETITRFEPCEDESLPRGAAGTFVPAGGSITDTDRFDNEFFCIPPREAEAMDPQHRLFLECAWHALEDAGYAGDDKPVTGLFAACGPPAYLLSQYCRDARMIDHLLYRTGNVVAALNGNEPDLLPLRAAYKFDLTGPVVNVQSACSSSLVAVAQACQSLACYESDMCMAGGVHVRSPDVRGYYHQREGILSRDGRCRPFDQDATGTVFGDGMGVVVLRRLEDAVADGDRVDAVIRGWAVNNDGSRKASLSAPSAKGQASVIAAAHALANVAPGSIQYLEAHGTGTVTGDRIELAGLRQAWGKVGESRCGIGSIKSNIGHLDAAAGVAGLIKTILCLKHRRLVPSLHCGRPLGELEDSAAPFYVVREAADWPDGNPRRAGVSSLGVGGTNCHLVLEERSRETGRGEAGAPYLLTLSARTQEALRALMERYIDHLRTAHPSSFGDICFTSNVGRRHLRFRLAVAADSARDCRDALAASGAHPQPGNRTASSVEPASFDALLERYQDGRETREQLFAAAAQFYEAGGDIDWERLHEGYRGCRVAAPLYPFEDRRHWRAAVSASGSDEMLELGERLMLPFSDEVRFHHRWHAGCPAYLSDHRIHDQVVFPASAHVSLLIATWQSQNGDGAGAFERIHFLRPLVMPSASGVDGQIILSGGGEAGSTVRLAASKGGPWDEYVLARSVPFANLEREDVDAITRRCPRTMGGDEFYRDVWAQGDGTGPSFRWLRSIAIGRGEALGRIARPADCRGTQSPHPGLLEAVFQLLYCCDDVETRRSVAETRSVLVPALMERVRWSGALQADLLGYARIRPRPAGAASVVGDLALLEPDGRAVLRIEGFELRPLRSEALVGPSALAGAYAIEWPAAPLQEAGTRRPLADSIVLLGERNRVSEELAQRLQTHTRVRIEPGRIDPEEDRAVDALLERGKGTGTLELVYLWPLSIQFDLHSPADLAPGIDTLLGGLIALFKAVARHPAPPPITVVTKRGQSVEGDAEECCPLQAAAWGLARVAARELSRVDVRLVDIEDESRASMDALVRESLHGDAEVQIAWRRGRRYAAWLRPAEDASHEASGPACGHYLVTADGGGQGELVAAHLRESGIRAETVDVVRGIDDLSKGPSDPGAPGHGPGVVHTSAAVEDGVLENASWREIREPLNQAMLELLRIHAVCVERGTPDFILFAGAAALLGHPGQAAYATLGAFADGLVRHRRALGLPGRSVFWGPWSAAGKWPHLTSRQRARLRDNGIEPMETRMALAAFDAVRRDGRTGLCLPGIDWPRFRAGEWLGRLLDRPATARQSGAPSRKTPDSDAAEGDTAQRVKSVVVEQLGVEAERIASDAPLRELGIDSLDAVNLIDAIELEFGVELSIGEVVDCAGLEALSACVDARSADRSESTCGSSFAPPPAPDAAIVMPLKRSSGCRPVFCVPADSSTALSMKPLCNGLETQRDMYAFQAPGIENDEAPLNTVEGLAGRYLEELLRLQPGGPYTLLGRCTGGLVAFEMALALQRRGNPVDRLILLDTLPPVSLMESALGDDTLRRRRDRIQREIAARIEGMPGSSRPRFLAVQNALNEAISAYAPCDTLAGDMTYVRSLEDRHEVQESWRRMVRGEVEFVGVPGNHQTMFQGPCLAVLRDALASVL